MKYTQLGKSGLRIPRLALGTMTYGDPSSTIPAWGAYAWDDAAPFYRQSYEAGITFWDTANAYSAGVSEQLTGRAMREFASREEIVLATKVFFRMHEGPGGQGLSRKAIMENIDASLARLGTDYVDLYQIHRFDPTTPMEETMEALHDVVKAGKARYLGASAMHAWQFAELQHTADLGGWTRFVSMQNQYSLIYREEEREMMGLLAHQGVGAVPYSPLAKGKVTKPWGTSTSRNSNDAVADATFVEADKPVVDAVEAIAAERGVTMAQVALAWVLRHPVVSAPIVGATKAAHLDDAVAALDIDLTDDEVTALEEHYAIRSPRGF